MKKKLFKTIIPFAAIGLAFCMTSCGEEAPTTTTADVTTSTTDTTTTADATTSTADDATTTTDDATTTTEDTTTTTEDTTPEEDKYAETGIQPNLWTGNPGYVIDGNKVTYTDVSGYVCIGFPIPAEKQNANTYSFKVTTKNTAGISFAIQMNNGKSGDEEVKYDYTSSVVEKEGVSKDDGEANSHKFNLNAAGSIEVTISLPEGAKTVVIFLDSITYDENGAVAKTGTAEISNIIYTGEHPVAPVDPTDPTDPTDSEVNLITNGDFSDLGDSLWDDGGWKIYMDSWNEGLGKCTPDNLDAVGVINITNAGENTSSIQLTNSELNVEANKTYKVSVDLWADQAGAVDVICDISYNPLDGCLWGQAITTEKATYTFTITTPESMTDENPLRFCLNLGNTTFTKVSVDNVKVVEVTE